MESQPQGEQKDQISSNHPVSEPNATAYVTPQSEVAPLHERSRKPFMLIIILLVVLLLGGIGLAVWMLSGQQKTETVSPTAVPTVRTYENPFSESEAEASNENPFEEKKVNPFDGL